jgi:hypothetical protein
MYNPANSQTVDIPRLEIESILVRLQISAIRPVERMAFQLVQSKRYQSNFRRRIARTFNRWRSCEAL